MLEDNLLPDELNIIRAFNYKVDTVLKDSHFEKLFRAFPTLPDIPSIYHLQQSIRKLSGVHSVPYDCCPSSCVCYCGPYDRLSECPCCHAKRCTESGRSEKQFHYIPIIPRLIGMYANPTTANKLLYRASYNHTPGITSDIFDSNNYLDLLNRRVRIGEETLPYWFFEDKRDMALGISFDGFGPFKRRKHTCWPIIIFNYNLPPTERFRLENIIPLGSIPGPRQMKDSDSFLLPFVQECLSLARGVKAFDAHNSEYFILHAFVIVAFGDIPAVSKLMKMKGVNALLPCRMCSIKGNRVPGSRSTAHYVSLTQPDGSHLDPLDLPLRSHIQFLAQAHEVSNASTDVIADELAKRYGIKGVPILSWLSSLSFPDSFPGDFMHIVWENIVKQLLDMWCSNYKGMGEGSGSYQLQPTIISAIAEGITKSGSTVPSSYGCRTPNIETERHHFTAEAWSMWTMLLGPVLLRGRFREDKYYKHFVRLVQLLNTCLQLTVTAEEIDQLELGFAKWVQSFER